MSFKKFRFIDLLIFVIIYLVLEFLIETGATKWFPEQPFSVSLLLPISILVMVRWEWYSIPNVIIYGLAYVLFVNRPGTISQYLIYGLGQAGLCLLIFGLTHHKQDKILKKWYYTALYVLACYIVTNLFRGIGAIIFCKNSLDVILEYLLTDTLNLMFAIVVVLICRKSNGLLINQKTYLLALEKEKEEKRLKALKEEEELTNNY